MSEVLVRQWETGHRVPVMDHVTKLDEMFDMRGILVRIREELVKASVPLEWFGRWTEIEGRASSLWSFQPMVVPGLLQTEDYARAILQAANHLADVEEMVAARIERQKILSREQEPPMFVALIAESVLAQNVGGPEAMVGQLAYLSELADRKNVIVQIVPADSRACAGFAGPFVIANFDGGSDVAYVDHAISGEVVEHPEDLIRLRRMFDVFRADVLSQRKSLSLMIRMAGNWKR